MENVEKKKIGVIGAGSFGTSLATILANKGHGVVLWGRDCAQMEEMERIGENKKYLPEVKLHERLQYTNSLKDAIGDKDIILFAVPTQTFRDVLNKSVEHLDRNVPIVNVAKGIEKSSLKRLSQVACEIAPDIKYIALSGPSHAEEVARYMPTTVAISGGDKDTLKMVQKTLFTDRFRVYTNDDLVGVELGGALKNIIALGAGVSDGIGYGDNAKAALMTRGIVEITRLGVRMGAQKHTFSGLTGIGDLIVTCTSMHSRNRRCGIKLGQGVDPKTAIEEVGMVVEGVSTTEAAWQLAEEMGVDMPITQCIYNVLEGNMTSREAVDILMGREMKDEMEK